MASTDIVELELEVQADNFRSWTVVDGSEYIDGLGKKRPKVFFIPKSLCQRHVDGSRVYFTMPEWLAKDRGLI